MKYFTLPITILFALAGLRAPAQQHGASAKPRQRTGVEVIGYPCAVIISPTLRQIDEMKKEDGADYDSIIDDDVYYQTEAEHVLDSLKQKKLERFATGIINFRTRDGKVFSVDLAKYRSAVILFNGKSKPVAKNVIDFAASP